MSKKESIEISITMEVDGKFRNLKKFKYGRGKTQDAFTLDDVARIVFMHEHMFSGNSTYFYDGDLQELENKLPKRENETAESVFQKYWVNFDKTMKEYFEKENSQGGFYGKELNDYLTFELWNICSSFSESHMPIKQGFLYFLHKYIMNGNISEYKSALENIPDYIKEIIDKKVCNKNE